MNTSHELKRNLKNRHIQMIALGGAIGTGLFYGSAETIQMVGPAIIFSYMLGGLVTFFIIRALGEMSVDEPVSGSFGHYAYKYWGDFAGFFSGWNYWFNYIIVSMAELSVVGIYINYWFPTIPLWVSALISLLFFTMINLRSVKTFGEFEFWFALIKVVAVIAMILFGLYIIFFGISNGYGNENGSNNTPLGFSNLWKHGGLFPKGLIGMFLSLGIVMFSFGGIELIGITAGEADNPQKTIPKAINQVMYRILIFYVGALLVIMAIHPWNTLGTEGSPFVSIFSKLGITSASTILNIVVISACLSTYNSGLYSNGRMLHALALQNNAPHIFTTLNRSGVPIVGVLFSSLLTLIAVLFTYLAPKSVFYYLVCMATSAGIFNWCMILITQMKFRKKLSQEQIDKLAFKMPLYPYSNYFCLAFLLLVVIMMGFLKEMRPALIVGPLWIVLLYVSYKMRKI